MLFKKPIIAFLLLLIIQTIHAQSKSDSIKRLILNEKVAEKKVDLIFKLAQTFRRKSSDSAIYYAEKSLNKATEIDYTFGIANANIAIAWSYYTKSNHKKAALFSQEAIKHYNTLENRDAKIGNCYRLLAAICTKEKKAEKALKHLLKAKDLYDDPNIKNKEVRTLVLNDIAYLYLEMDNYIMSMNYLNESIATAKENDQTATLADCYNILATVTSRQGDFDKAIEYYNLSKKIYIKRNDLLGISICNTNIGITHYRKKSFNEAIQYLEESKEQATDIQFNLGLMESLVYLGKAHIKLNNTEAAGFFLNEANHIAQQIKVSVSDVIMAESELESKKGNFLNAIRILEDYLKNNSTKLSPKEKIELFKSLSTAYEIASNYKQALYTKSELFRIQDSINDVSKEVQVRILQAEFDYKKVQIDLENKKVELQVSEEKRHSSRLLNILLISAGILLIIATILVFLRRKSLRKTRKIIWKTKQELQATKQKQLDSEIDFKNKQITDFALHISEKNELLTSIKSKIKSLELTDKTKLNKLADLTLFLNNNLEQNKEKVAIYSVADNTKEAFYHKLSDLYPELTTKEKRVAAFVRLDLTSKQIAIQQNISISSIDNYRYNLRKKMEVSKEVSLSDFLKNI